MKCIILAGGMQSTLTRENESIPMPMIEIGGKPLIWHIMKHFSEYGINEFIVCGGYKIDVIKQYFMDFYVFQSDITVDLSNNTVTVHSNRTEDWKVSVVDTGIEATVLQRVRAVKELAGDDFIVTYGDCLSDIDVGELIEAHKGGAIGTLALTKSTGRKKFVQYDSISEGGVRPSAWINADICVLNKEIFRYSNIPTLDELINELNADGKLAIYKHRGYWAAIETMRDLMEAQQLWESHAQTWVKNR